LKEVRQNQQSGRPAHRNLLVSAEVALGFILLIGAGCCFKPLQNCCRSNPGFVPANVLTFRVSVPWEKYNNSMDAVQFLRR